MGYKLGVPKKEIKNPVAVIKEKKATKKVERQNKEVLEELNRIMDNINNYDGTSHGQKELKNIETGL